MDQLRTGNYGTAACEGLAAGRLTVAHISEHVRERTRRLTGEDLPVVDATPETLGDLIADIARRPGAYLRSLRADRTSCIGITTQRRGPRPVDGPLLSASRLTL